MGLIKLTQNNTANPRFEHYEKNYEILIEELNEKYKNFSCFKFKSKE